MTSFYPYRLFAFHHSWMGVDSLTRRRCANWTKIPHCTAADRFPAPLLPPSTSSNLRFPRFNSSEATRASTCRLLLTFNFSRSQHARSRDRLLFSQLGRFPSSSLFPPGFLHYPKGRRLSSNSLSFSSSFFVCSIS